jgi:hypothetical protein
MSSIYDARTRDLEDVLESTLKTHPIQEIRYPLAVKIAARLFGVKEDPTAIGYVKRLRESARRLKSNNVGFRL